MKEIIEDNLYNEFPYQQITWFGDGNQCRLELLFRLYCDKNVSLRGAELRDGRSYVAVLWICVGGIRVHVPDVAGDGGNLVGGH